MLVARPGKPDPTTATTPTPIGCKLLKINRLTQQKLLASPFREVRILQNLSNTATLISKQPCLPSLSVLLFSIASLALRFKEVRILQSKTAPSTLSAKLF